MAGDVEPQKPIHEGQASSSRIAILPAFNEEQAIGRVIRNLVDNAIRYAPPDTTVDVVVEPGEPATVRVVDRGPGFPAEFSAHAFERFARADQSRARATGGAGLGLVIARGLVEAHGGRIWIEPARADRVGGRVVFQLPGA